MTYEEIIQALRVCSRRTDAQTCAKCPLFDSEDCMGDMMVGAADLIERLTAENAALRQLHAAYTGASSADAPMQK